MPAPIALQLYTLREAAEAEGFEFVAREVAEVGYVGVETAGFPGTTPEAAARLFTDLGLEVCSAHLPLPIADNRQQSLDTAATLSIERVVSGCGRDDFSSRDKIRATADRFNEAADVCRQAGLTFGIHNHWWEFKEVEGALAYEHLLEDLDDYVFFQLDAYWVQTAGPDPVAILRELGARVPLVHVKDGPCDQESDMLALGEGVADISSLIEAGSDHVDWWIVELDRCETDMMEAVVKSYDFLVRSGHAGGNK